MRRFAFQKFVAAVRARMIMSRALESAGYAVLAASVGAGMMEWLNRWVAASPGVIGWIATAMAIAVWAVSLGYRWPTPQQAVRAIDRHLNAAELFASAQSCVAASADGWMAAAVVALADATSAATKPALVPVSSFTRRRWAAIALAIAAAISVDLLVLMPGGRPTAVSSEALTDDALNAASSTVASHSSTTGAGADSVVNRREPGDDDESPNRSSLSDERSPDEANATRRSASGQGPGVARDSANAIVSPRAERPLMPSSASSEHRASTSTGVGDGPAVDGGRSGEVGEPTGTVQETSGHAATVPSVNATTVPRGGTVSAAVESTVPPAYRDLVRAFHDASRDGNGG